MLKVLQRGLVKNSLINLGVDFAQKHFWNKLQYIIEQQHFQVTEFRARIWSIYHKETLYNMFTALLRLLLKVNYTSIFEKIWNRTQWQAMWKRFSPVIRPCIYYISYSMKSAFIRILSNSSSINNMKINDWS